jgi:hypothetical protein
VGAWLAEVGLGALQAGFRREAIDGEVLLSLTDDDLKCIGVPTLGARTKLKAKIAGVKKRHYAGQVVGGGAAAAPGGDDGAFSEEQRRLVLEHVLQENTDLAARIAALTAEGGAAEAAAAPPPNFECPITTAIMEDPVVAMDGHT